MKIHDENFGTIKTIKIKYRNWGQKSHIRTQMGQIKVKCNEERASNKQSDGKAYFEFKLYFIRFFSQKMKGIPLNSLLSYKEKLVKIKFFRMRTSILIASKFATCNGKS